MKTNRAVTRDLLLIAGISAIIFFNAAGNGFVLDDVYIIEQNNNIKNISNVPSFFKSDYWAGTRYEGESSALYRPLVITSYAIDHALWGLRPAGFHIVNIILHTVNAALVYFFVFLLLKKENMTALLCALLFLTHPVHVEAVTGVVGRSELMCFLFFMLALFSYAAAGKGMKYYALSITSFAFALLSKEVALVLPAVLVLYDLYGAGKPVELKKNILKYSGYFLAIAGYMAVRYAVFGKIFSSSGQGIFYRQNTLTRLFTMCKVFLSYLKFTVLPVNFKTDYNNFPLSSTLDAAVAASILALSLYMAVLALSYRKNRTVFLTAGWFLVCLLPVSNIVPFGAIFAERFLYMPSVAFCIACGLGACGLRKEKRLPSAAAACLAVLFFSAGTLKYNERWKSNDTLWESAVKKAPGNARVHYAVGVVKMEKGGYKEAIPEFLKSVEIDPYIPEAYNNLCVCYNNTGAYEEAIAMGRKALEHKADYFEAYINLGNVYKSIKKEELAGEVYRKAIEINPKSSDAHYNLGLLFYQRGMKGEALKHFRSITEFDPYYEAAWLGVSGICIEENRLSDAMNELNRALKILPGRAAIIGNIGLVYFYGKDYNNAISKFKEAVSINPRDACLYNRLGSSYGNAGRYEEAIINFKKAIEVKPGYEEAGQNLEKLNKFLGKSR